MTTHAEICCTGDDKCTLPEDTGLMNEYRMTCNGPYTEPTCAGHTDLKARQGHYVVASSEEEARQILLKEHPDETFTCTHLRCLCTCVSFAGYEP